MNIEYTYTIVKVDESAKCMEVVYVATGHQTMHVGARLPFDGEPLETIIRQYAPINYWIDQQRAVAIPLVGTSGTLTPIVENTVPVEDVGFSTIFPTRATGAINTTIF